MAEEKNIKNTQIKKSSNISSGKKIKSVPTHANDTKSSGSKKGKKGIYSPNLKILYLEKIINKLNDIGLEVEGIKEGQNKLSDF